MLDPWSSVMDHTWKLNKLRYSTQFHWQGRWKPDICQESIIVDVLFFAIFNPLALQTTTVSVRGWVDLVLSVSNNSHHRNNVKSPDTWESGVCNKKMEWRVWCTSCRFQRGNRVSTQGLKFRKPGSISLPITTFVKFREQPLRDSLAKTNPDLVDNRYVRRVVTT